jgi:MFS family permease
MRERLAGLNYTLIAIVAEGFLSRLSFGLISFALPLYAYRIGLSLTEVGFLASLNVAVALALKPAMGWAADRVGLKRSFTFAIGLRSLVALLLAFAGTPWQLFALRGVHGMSKSIRDPSANALIAEYGGKKAIASAFAWYQTAKSVAGSVGKATAGILLTLTASNFSLVFFVSFILSALPLLTVAYFVREPERGEKASAEEAASIDAPPEEEATAPPEAQERPPAILPYASLGLLITTSAEMLGGLFPIIATEYAGLSEAETGIIYAVSTFLILFAGPFFGWLSDNVSQKLVLGVRSVANVLSSILYLLFPNLAGVVSGKLVDDMGKAAFRPAWGSLMAHISSFDRKRRARTMSVVSLGEDAGDIIGPVLAGFLWNTYGIVALFGVRIGIAVVAEIYAVVLQRSMRKHESATAPPDAPAEHEERTASYSKE